MYDVIVIGAGQAGLAISYYLRRAELDFILLDAESEAGGAWLHTWDSLRLFSPAAYSSLPGWPMPQPTGPGNPARDDVVAYLAAYETRYGFHVERPVRVRSVESANEGFLVAADTGSWQARAVVSATGTFGTPLIPEYPDQAEFRGEQLHSADYRSAARFAGKTVLVVGGGNSGAQILAEVSSVARAVWVTPEPPLFLPDDVDGRVLFERATARFRAGQEGRGTATAEGGLGNIVMVPSVLDARDRGVLHAVRPFVRFNADGVVWGDRTQTMVDAVIWCTGFRPDIGHLRPLGIVDNEGRVATEGARSIQEPRVWLLGYGDWTGAASATLIGVSRTARELGKEIASELAV